MSDDDDELWMKLAISEASQGLGMTSPNPAVGAVIVKNGKLQAKGWHKKAGEAHAEREALADAHTRGENLKGSSIYVTLEPCSTFGRTPPCTAGLIESGIKRVVYGAEDPNPSHQGGAKEILELSGIEVLSGVLKEECEELIRGFSKVQRTGLPWVLIKSAMSLDGRITRPPGESQWLTSPESRELVQQLRYESDAIITGGNTLRKDDPALTLRSDKLPHKEQPWRMVITEGLKESLPCFAQVFTDRYSDRTLIQENGDLYGGLKNLAKRGCNQVLVEAGGKLLGAFIDAGLVDELAIFYAPLITGGPNAGFSGLAQEFQLAEPTFSQIGNDVYLRAKLLSNSL